MPDNARRSCAPLVSNARPLRRRHAFGLILLVAVALEQPAAARPATECDANQGSDACLLGSWEGAIGDHALGLRVQSDAEGTLRVFVLPRERAAASLVPVHTTVVRQEGASLRWSSKGRAIDITLGPDGSLRGSLRNQALSYPIECRRRAAGDMRLLRSPALVLGMNLALFGVVVLRLLWGRRRKYLWPTHVRPG
jgi:hypothetical protein